MKRYGHTIIIISVVCGLFITVCDYLVQMTTVDTNYFVSRLLSLNSTVLNLSSYGCIFALPFWLTGAYFVYAIMRKVNKRLALICTGCMIYALLMLGFFHYSYAMIHKVGMAEGMAVAELDWEVLTKANIPFYPFMFILLPASWLVIGCSNFSSKSIVPRWSIVINPVVLTILSSIMAWIYPAIFQKTQPGIFSLGITLYFIICWISLKKG